jgi:hypothetical protein
MTKVAIEIPKVKDSEVFNIPKGQLGFLKDHLDKQFGKIDKLLFAIVTSVIVSVVAVLISAIGLFIDQMRYNNVAYKEYSKSIQAVSDIHDSNSLLLEQNKKNQEIIIELHNQILKIKNN